MWVGCAMRSSGSFRGSGLQVENGSCKVVWSGMSLLVTSARCPVLVLPPISIEADREDNDRM